VPEAAEREREAQPAEPPALSLPKGGGAIRGIGERFEVNPATGTGNFSVPIATSKSRSDFGPKLNLSYDSGYGNGPFGFGWRLSENSISRRTDRGVPRYEDGEDSDTFLLSGADDLVRTGAPAAVRLGHRVERYRPRTERDFTRVERWTRLADGDVHWRTITADNVLTVYGLDAASRIADPSDPARVFSWLACQCYDDKGNAIEYEYAAEDAANVDLSAAAEQGRERGAVRYLKRIRHGNRVPLLVAPGTPSFRQPHLPKPDLAGARWMFEIVFDYGEGHYSEAAPDGQGRTFVTASPGAPPGASRPVRPDSFSSYRAGFELRMHRLCRRVLVFHRFEAELGTPACLVRSTELGYRETPTGSFVERIVQAGFRRLADGRYLKRSHPPLELAYSRSPLEDPAYDGGGVEELDAGSLENLSTVVDPHHSWTDLDGEGIAGVLSQEGNGWWYKPNLGEGRLGPARLLEARPSLQDGGRQIPLDLAGDGVPDLVWIAEPGPGFNARDPEAGFAPFREFASFPTLDWIDTRLVDVVGDGLADLLVAEGDALRWHRSLGREGFDAGSRVDLPHDEDAAPRVVFGDPAQAVLLADMSGDGLADIVRVRDGEVCYWPNLGYGRFGRRVVMDGAPSLDPPEQFNPARVRLADTDGSGTVDLVYLGADAVRISLNLSGNAWSSARVLRGAPAAGGATTLGVADLLGQGTACLIWSSTLAADASRPVRYLDLAGGAKPHLLVEIKNNLGAETRVSYASSTKFHLADKLAGRPWATRLPFPVHVVERTDTLDRVSRNRYVTRYSYHHGHFDGEEREFRGFGRVDQLDTEELAALEASPAFPDAQNVDAASYVPPVRTRTWFHTGAREPLEHEYSGQQLAGVALQGGLPAAEARAARRALTGATLRLEVCGLDGSDVAERPYLVRENGYSVVALEPGVYHARPSESVELEFDRDAPADPRVSHTLDLDVDGFGNVRRAVSVAYGRSPGAPADPLLGAEDVALQRETHVTYVDSTFTNDVSLDDAHRAPIPAERSRFELRNAAPAGARFEPGELDEAIDAAGDGQHDLAADDFEGEGVGGSEPFRRLLERVRTLYRPNNLGGTLPLGQLQSLALTDRTLTLALTAELAEDVYVTSGKLTAAQLAAALAGDGAYVHSEGDADWWVPTGRVAYSPDPAATAGQELVEAADHFFLPRREIDPFGASTRTDYDAHDLLPVERRDPLDNRTRAANDYRVLQPVTVTDPNGNRSAALYDALGELTATALMGKDGEGVGDSLAGLDPDPPDADVLAHLADPPADPHALLGSATTRRIPFRGTTPAVIYTLAREVHEADLAGGAQTEVQLRLAYSDGLGREVQVKQFESPGRWVTDGWTILDNKGRPVRRYEPFVDDTPAYRFGATAGVSPIVFRDPLGRVPAVAHPHHAWQKAVAGPWRTEEWDVNDTVLADPKTDADAGAYFARLPDAAYLPTWHAQRAGGGLGPHEQRAAAKAAIHAGTPTVAFSDALGRVFLTVWHNRIKRSSEPAAAPPVEERHRQLVVYDVAGNERRQVDARGRTCARHAYDMLGRRIHSETMENGERWMLVDAAGSPIRAWDSRGHAFASTYDPLRRLLTRSVRGTDAARSDPRTLAAEVVYERREYGEGLPGDTASNLRTRLVRVRDGAGVLTTDLFDFKGNMLRREQELVRDFDQLPDWSGAPVLEAESFVNTTTYDALDRVETLTAPDGTVGRVGYDRMSRLATLELTLPGQAGPTAFVEGVAYDARGRRTRIDYGNGVRTTCEYDPLTLRLTRQLTTRPADADAFAARVFANATTLQNLRHTYDPLGNLVRIADDALRTVVAAGQPVRPEIENDYDAVYRLIETSGREQSDPANIEALRPYSESYVHDVAGNLLRMVHTANGGGNWERTYEYDEPSALEPGEESNRLTRAAIAPEAPPAFTYDAHGCMTRMPHLSLLRWDFRDQLEASARQVAQDPETTFYAYDAAGGRVRKVVRRANGTRSSERIYLAGAEVYREYAGNGSTVSLRRDSVHVMDDRRRIALVERVAGSEPAIRYQLANHLESVCVEVDDAGAVITFEEFTPFGTPAVHGGRAAAEVSLKRYRYTGRERDEETGFGCHGLRYYAPWLGRWTSCDPEGLAAPRAGPDEDHEDLLPRCWNLYVYARDNPYLYTDPTGRVDETKVAISIVACAAPLLALLGVSIGLQLAGVPVPGGTPDDPGDWIGMEEAALFDIWTLGHYFLPWAISVLVAAALNAWTTLSPEEIYVIAGMAGSAWAFVYETFERPLFAAMHQFLRPRTSESNPFTKATAAAALEWRINTMEDVVLGSVGAFTGAYLLLMWEGRAPNLEFAIAFFVLGATFFGILGAELIYGGHIQSRDTHRYDPENNRFLPKHAIRDRLDPRYTPFADTAVA
jgi:RHS repeat-associated protein